MAPVRAKLTPWEDNFSWIGWRIDGWKPADAARAMGVSRQTAYKWLRRFREEGCRGLGRPLVGATALSAPAGGGGGPTDRVRPARDP